MRHPFDLKLQELQQSILRMGSMVEQTVSNAVRALAEQDTVLARKVVEFDDSIDDAQEAIEQSCMHAIALQAPLAGDLRLISAIVQIATDLERMGDHATNIAEVALRVGHTPLIKPLVDIPKMAQMAQNMLRQSLDSFVRRDTELAQRVGKMDDPVDEIYAALFDELADYVMRCDDPARGQQAINLLFVARDLERIADHASNVAERTIFAVTGTRVRFNKQPST
ncbi:MAG: phosphate signaling complex protein PhoU [Firmicutes bacterium]|jgi:phosphate transport system protein|nr:phosphate signaling complex protein PhoU [Bacillota bacterium]